jgi:hypothetical protein
MGLGEGGEGGLGVRVKVFGFRGRSSGFVLRKEGFAYICLVSAYASEAFSARMLAQCTLRKNQRIQITVEFAADVHYQRTLSAPLAAAASTTTPICSSSNGMSHGCVPQRLRLEHQVRFLCAEPNVWACRFRRVRGRGRLNGLHGAGRRRLRRVGGRRRGRRRRWSVQHLHQAIELVSVVRRRRSDWEGCEMGR